MSDSNDEAIEKLTMRIYALEHFIDQFGMVILQNQPDYIQEEAAELHSQYVDFFNERIAED